MNKKPYFISTAIPYVNAAPHIGFALELVQADALARFHRQQGREVFFLTGTDENSLKNVRAAEKAGLGVQEFVEKNAVIFRSLKDVLNLSWDDFIRTREERHIAGAQKLWEACKKDIYKKKYKGLYCVDCEAYYQESELVEGLCPDHKKELEVVEEENYFFKLSLYQTRIEEALASGTVSILPESRKREVEKFVEGGLEDICVSRSAERAKGWGVPVPGDQSQVMWVWFDALSNYINAVGYGDNPRLFQEKWTDAERAHVVGKGIARFHAVHWLGILLSAGVQLPTKILVHGYVTIDGEKISKSLGNVVDPVEVVEKYGADATRYFLLREIPSGGDGDFGYAKLEARYKGDLADGIGNLVRRVLKLAEGIERAEEIADGSVRQAVAEAREKRNAAVERFALHEALEAVWKLVAFCDEYVDAKKPWRKESVDKGVVVRDLVVCIQILAELIDPFLPKTAESIRVQLKGGEDVVLFPRLDKGD